MDALVKLHGSSLELRVYVGASVSKAAAQKGAPIHVKFMSKTHGVNLFWIRYTLYNVLRMDLSLEKMGALSKVADLLTKPLCRQRTVALRKALGVAQNACSALLSVASISQGFLAPTLAGALRPRLGRQQKGGIPHGRAGVGAAHRSLQRFRPYHLASTMGRC